MRCVVDPDDCPNLGGQEGEPVVDPNDCPNLDGTLSYAMGTALTYAMGTDGEVCRADFNGASNSLELEKMFETGVVDETLGFKAIAKQ